LCLVVVVLLLQVELGRGGGGLGGVAVRVGLGACHLLGEIQVALLLARVKGGRDAVGMLQLRGSSAVDINEVCRRRGRGVLLVLLVLVLQMLLLLLLLRVLLLCEITPGGAGVGLKGFAGAEGRVGGG
jgi:hypothetical protein